jgi:hypothetical protein
MRAVEKWRFLPAVFDKKTEKSASFPQKTMLNRQNEHPKVGKQPKGGKIVEKGRFLWKTVFMEDRNYSPSMRSEALALSEVSANRPAANWK